MPLAAIMPAVATIIAGGAAAGATAYGAHSAGKSASRAQSIQSKSDDAALQFEREREAEARRQWDAQQQFEQQKWQVQEEQRLHDRALADAAEARRAPYRQASQAALGRLGEMLGLNFDSGVQPPSVAPAGAGSPMPSQPPTSRLMNSPMFGGLAMPESRAVEATEPAYAPVNPMTTGSLLGLRRRPTAPRYA